jgi:hypothetical protein
MESRLAAACSLVGIAAGVLLPLLCACTTTGIVDSENPSKNLPQAWADYWTLPVLIHGSVAGVPDAEFAEYFPGTRPLGGGS